MVRRRWFGRAGPPGRGYYSFDLGTWHIISLNSAVDMGRRSPQGRWLADDLAAHPTDCVLAYWHVPAFSSGPHGTSLSVRDLWRQLVEAGVDLVVGAEGPTVIEVNGNPSWQGILEATGLDMAEAIAEHVLGRALRRRVASDHIVPDWTGATHG